MVVCVGVCVLQMSLEELSLQKPDATIIVRKSA